MVLDAYLIYCMYQDVRICVASRLRAEEGYVYPTCVVGTLPGIGISSVGKRK